jgi:hypothetical protein
MSRTSIIVAVRRTANPAQVAWEVSGAGERGYLRLYLNLANTPVCQIGQSGFAVARGGIHTISPNAAVDCLFFGSKPSSSDEKRL